MTDPTATTFSREENRDRILRHLYTQQVKSEGATPGRLKNTLRMTDEELTNALQGMVDSGEVEVLPPDHGGGRGRRSPLILPTRVLRGPDPSNVMEMVDTNFVPKLTDQHNPLLDHERARRGSIGTFKPVTGMDAVTESLNRVKSLMDRNRGAGFTRDEFIDFCTPNIPHHVADLTFTRLASPLCAEHWMVNGLRRLGNNDHGASVYRPRFATETTNEHGTPLQTALWYAVDKIFDGNWNTEEVADSDERRLDNLMEVGGPAQLLDLEGSYLKGYEVDDERLETFAGRVSDALGSPVNHDDAFLFCLMHFSNDWYSADLQATLAELALDPPDIEDVISDRERSA